MSPATSSTWPSRSADLDEAEAFYVGGLGCKLARRYDDRITVDFFGDQLVCHLSDQTTPTRPSTRATSASPSAGSRTSTGSCT